MRISAQLFCLSPPVWLALPPCPSWQGWPSPASAAPQTLTGPALAAQSQTGNPAQGAVRKSWSRLSARSTERSCSCSRADREGPAGILVEAGRQVGHHA